ncbi:MAG TPA: hypothetical protein VL393_05615 [Candidatus Binataceae bacterium]|jgi:hypothetical protein|nr:hypothetical protein [Candidatus Binataceae bacterium]
MTRKHKGKIVVLHLAARYPFAGVMWQLIHHLVGLRELGFDVYYLEDHGAWVFDPIADTVSPNAGRNLKLLAAVMERYGFRDRWAFFDVTSGEYQGMGRERSLQLLAEADAVINLCGATEPREEHRRTRCLVYLETDPGAAQVRYADGEPLVTQIIDAHRVHFTYAANIGEPDCLLPTTGLRWHPTRPPVLLGEWPAQSAAPMPAAFTTVGTWRNKGNDVEFGGRTYYWSKHVNFVKMLDVPRRAAVAVELATDLSSGPDYERALAGGFTFRPVVPMSLDIDTYRGYVSASRGEFTVAKDLYVSTHSGWFSDRTVCYLAAGRPAVTQFTGFEKFIPAGAGLVGFADAAEAVEALRAVAADYPRHARAAREIACEYFDARRLLGELAGIIGL